MTRFRQFWPWWRWILTALSSLGLALSGYLGWHYLTGGAVIGCGGGSPCDQVLGSRWSAIGGVLPVSGLAAGAYLAMLVAGFFIGPVTESPVRRLAWGAMLVLVGATAGSAVWFIIVQRWMIGEFCPYCMATHITGLLLTALVIWQVPKQFDDDSSDAPRMIRVLPAFGLAFVGIVLAGILAACQVYFKPPIVVYRGGELQEDLPAINPHTSPLVGSPDARYVVTLLFDYNCPHCQQLHFMLNDAIRRYNGKLAFVLCPAPLNTHCNPYIPQDVDEFKDSCELAKIAMAVWVARRGAFSTFDDWMFSPEPGHLWHPRTVEAATAKAVELVGQERFNAAMNDSWINQYLQNSIRIYGATTLDGNNAVPKLVFGLHWVIPQPNNAGDLVSILHDSLAVPKP